MKTNVAVPAWVDVMKILDWEGETPLHEGIISIETLRQEAYSLTNWLLFYCWCYARTQGFTNKCMKDWDFGCYGGKYKTCRDGVRDALGEFLKYDDTSLLAEQVEVEKLYNEIEAFCRGVIWTEPHPLPEKPKPEPKPPEPVPEEPKPQEPKPEEPKPDTPNTGSGFDWKKVAKIALPILGLLAAVGGMFLPGWAKTVLDYLMKILQGLAG
jgi:hypothetical protein